MGSGIITLMGSGEFSGTMVEVHKELTQRYGSGVEAVFLDTPAGFQLNVDALSARAVAYFDRHIQQPLTVVSLKGMNQADTLEIAQAYDLLSRADYILMGPGSPTYALAQWRSSRIPEIFKQHLLKGGSIVAASAAALTMGSLTLPVYEIYKVGQDPHWVDGLQVLDHFGFHWAVMPHWNNTEGGNHDTRFCFMGRERLRHLRRQLPESVSILGLDEHTALQIDLAQEAASVSGLGQITLLSPKGETRFSKGDRIPLGLLREGIPSGSGDSAKTGSEAQPATEEPDTEDFWEKIHGLESRIKGDLAQDNIENATRALLDLEGYIWQVHSKLMEKEALGAVRDMFRELLADLGSQLSRQPGPAEELLDPLVKNLLILREGLRKQKNWREADAIRESLLKAGVVINDTADGVQWQFVDKR